MVFKEKSIGFLLFLWLFQGFSLPGQGQFLHKVKEHRFKNDLAEISVIEKTADGGYITGGSIPVAAAGATSIDPKPLDFMVVKRDSTGAVSWEKRYEAPWYEELNEIVPLPDGGYLLCGEVTNREAQMLRLYDKHKPGTGSMDFYLVRIDGKGQKLWDKVFQSPGHDRFRVVKALPDGGFLLGGNSMELKERHPGDPLFHYEADYDTKSTYRLFRIDGSGNVIWTRRFAGSDDATLTAIQPLPGGGFLLLGWSNSGMGLDRTAPKSPNLDFWVLKIDENGNKIWDKAYSGKTYDYAQAITPLADGNFLLTGNFNAIKIDPDGKQLWDQTYFKNGKHYDKIVQVLPLPDGGFLMGGFALSEKTSKLPTPGNHTSQDYDLYLLKADKLGNLVWSQKIGGSTWESFQLFRAAQGNTFWLGGTTNSPQGFDIGLPKKGDWDFWLVQVKENPGPAIYAEARAAAICAGNTFSLPFRTNQPFGKDNVFTAQLSDSAGNFTSPLEIGKLKTQQADSLVVTIPGTIPAGNNYQVRVVASQPAVTGAGNQARLRVMPSTLKAELVSLGPGHLVLNPTGGLPPYQQTANSESFFDNPQNRTYSFNNLGVGEHFLKVKDAAGCLEIIPVSILPLQQCGNDVRSGNARYSLALHQLSGKPGTVTLAYNFPEEPVMLEVFMNGKPVAATGKAIKGSGALSFRFDPAAGEDKCYVKVTSLKENPKWNYRIYCPGE